MFKINFFSPDEGGASGEAVSSANESDDLFETVEGSDAESDNQLIDGIKAVNTKDSEGDPLKTSDKADDEPESESFESLVKGRYKKEAQAYIDGIFKKRFPNIKENEALVKSLKEERDMIQPLFNAMAAKYGLDPKDIKGIVEAADKDNTNFENEAFEKGFSDASAYRKYITEQEELERLRENDRVRKETEENNQQREQLIKGWLTEADSLKSIVPDFNFKNEWNGNERFRYFLNSGFSVEESYKMTHVDEYAEAKAKAAAEKAQNDILREVRANKSRPTETNANPQAAVRVKKAISDMTLEDTEKIIQEAKRGRKVSF